MQSDGLGPTGGNALTIHISHHVCSQRSGADFATLVVSLARQRDSKSLQSNRRFLIMLKGFGIAVICIGTLVAVDHGLNSGIYTDQALGMLRQFHYSFWR